jgi:UDP-N-acetyl-D-mannosaminuronate dehydrogenase
MKNVLVIGLGEVGMALYEIIKESGQYNAFGLDLKIKTKQVSGRIGILHICIPYSKFFVKLIADYVKFFEPDLLIINSTVSPSTTNKIASRCSCLVAFSPVFATHSSRESFKADIRRLGKFVGGTTEEASIEAAKHFVKIGVPVKINSNPLIAEISKLYCTTYYGVLIALAQDFHRLSRKYNVNFAEVVDNIGYLHGKALNKPPAYPDVIGGHCVMPNIDVLLDVQDSDLLKAIKASNEKRKIELIDNEVQEEVLATKKVVEQFWKTLREKKWN